MYEKYLTAAGISPKEAVIYEALLAEGELTASQLHKKTPYKRGLVYKLLDELVEKRLAVKIDKPQKVSVFRVEHPYRLNELVDAQSRKLDYYKKSIDELIPQMVSSYNLAFHKPGVRFYEGMEGIKKVLEDSLTSQETIMTYADVEAIVKHIDKINRDYVKKRERRNLKKKGVVIDTPFVRQYLKDYHALVTDTRFIKSSPASFGSVMQIYDGKVAYITLGQESKIGVIIADKNIYNMHKSLFLHTWEHALPFDQLPPFSNAQ